MFVRIVAVLVIAGGVGQGSTQTCKHNLRIHNYILETLSGFNLTTQQFAECWREHIRDNIRDNKTYVELRLSNVSSVTLGEVVGILQNTSERVSGVSNVTSAAAVDISLTWKSFSLPIVPAHLFTDLHTLKELILEHDHISDLAPHAFYNLSRLDTLSLRYNNLTRIANRTFVNLSRLNKLKLSYNRIFAIEPVAFFDVKTLDYVDLRHNLLKTLPHEALTIHNQLYFLHLGDNELTDIGEDSLASFPNLEQLHIQNNALQTLPRKLKSTFLRLDILSLRGNPWRCDCGLRWLVNILVQRPDLIDTLPVCAAPDQLTNVSFDLVNFTWSCGPDIPESTTDIPESTTDIPESTTDIPESTTDVDFVIAENTTNHTNDVMTSRALTIWPVVLVGAGLFVIGVTAMCIWRRRTLASCFTHRKGLQPLYRLTKNLTSNQNYYSPHKSSTHTFSGPTHFNKAQLDTYEYEENDTNGDILKSDAGKTMDEAGEFYLILEMDGHRGYGKVWLDRPLGFGHFGSVRLGHASVGGYSRHVAVKRIVHVTDSKEILHEIQNAMMSCRHENIINIYGFRFFKDAPTIVMELADGGDLDEYLRQLRAEVSARLVGMEAPQRREYLHRTQPQLYTFMLHVAWGMKHLAKLKIVHRDLAARNILICEGRVAKISDFGLSRDIYGTENYRRQTDRPLPFRSLGPESLSSGTFTSKSDVWAFGILLWEVTSLGKRPYEHVTATAPAEVPIHDHLCSLLISGYRLEPPDLCPIELEVMMRACWAGKPEDRPPFSCLANRLQHFIDSPPTDKTEHNKADT